MVVTTIFYGLALLALLLLSVKLKQTTDLIYSFEAGMATVGYNNIQIPSYLRNRAAFLLKKLTENTIPWYRFTKWTVIVYGLALGGAMGATAFSLNTVEYVLQMAVLWTSGIVIWQYVTWKSAYRIGVMAYAVVDISIREFRLTNTQRFLALRHDPNISDQQIIEFFRGPFHVGGLNGTTNNISTSIFSDEEIIYEWRNGLVTLTKLVEMKADRDAQEIKEILTIFDDRYTALFDRRST